jgi:hypothetical protein
MLLARQNDVNHPYVGQRRIVAHLHTLWVKGSTYCADYEAQLPNPAVLEARHTV